MKVIVVAKKKKPLKNVHKILRNIFNRYDLILGEVGDRFPVKKMMGKYDLLISYLSPWIIPKKILKRNKLNINFHPGPPNYPGIGCVNFAILNKEKFYGCTAHVMNKKVDTGKILAIRKFKIDQNTTVNQLLNRTYKEMEKLLLTTIKKIKNNKKFPNSIKWKKKPYKRKDFLKIFEINKKDSVTKIKKIIQATNYSDYPGAYIKLANYKFQLIKD
jgi:methionyl-tRNA formyltransferase